MRCPNCKSDNTYVISHSKKVVGGEIFRRRKCSNCGYKFKTVEFFADEDLVYRHGAGKVTLEWVRQIMKRRKARK